VSASTSVRLLTEIDGVGVGVGGSGVGVGAGVGDTVGFGVGAGVGSGEGVGAGVGTAVGVGVGGSGVGVGATVGRGVLVGAGVGGTGVAVGVGTLVGVGDGVGSGVGLGLGVGEADNRFFTLTQCALEAKTSAGLCMSWPVEAEGDPSSASAISTWGPLLTLVESHGIVDGGLDARYSPSRKTDTFLMLGPACSLI
jgi:hypothetical protein